jgi:hypothetical protein
MLTVFELGCTLFFPGIVGAGSKTWGHGPWDWPVKCGSAARGSSDYPQHGASHDLALIDLALIDLALTDSPLLEALGRGTKPALRQMALDEIYLGKRQEFLTVLRNLAPRQSRCGSDGNGRNETLDEFFQTELSAFQPRGMVAAWTVVQSHSCCVHCRGNSRC